MLQLVGAGIPRYGGSIALEYRAEDGSLVSVLLAVNACSDGEFATYGRLHMGSEIQGRDDTLTVVPKGSEREIALMKDIDGLRRGDRPLDEQGKGVVTLSELVLPALPGVE